VRIDVCEIAFEAGTRRYTASIGSGVILSAEGIVLTNAHVVSPRAVEINITLSNLERVGAKLVGWDHWTDLAVLRLDMDEVRRRGFKLTNAQFGDSRELFPGQVVYAVGTPHGLTRTVTRGIVSNNNRYFEDNHGIGGYETGTFNTWLQTDAAINPGNSGGPLVDLRGELVGVNVAIYREGHGIGFAIPIKRVSAALSEIYSPELLEKMWFGARISPRGPPWQVLSVQMESPAGKAGLRAGDQILQVNGKSPQSFIGLTRELVEAKDEHEVTLAVQRGTTRRAINVLMVPEKTFFNADLIRKKTGASLQELTPELAQGLGLAAAQGLLIAGVEKGSPAAGTELERGMVVTSIDGQSATDLVMAAKAVHAKSRGSKVQFEIVAPRRRGVFIELRQGTIELTLR
jgi:serine protease Do